MSVLQDVIRSVPNPKNTPLSNISSQSQKNLNINSDNHADQVLKASEEGERNWFQRAADKIGEAARDAFTSFGGSQDGDSHREYTTSFYIDSKSEFTGADWGVYRAAIEDGQSYNILSDKDFQLNAQFRKNGTEPSTTAMDEIGIVARDSDTGERYEIQVSKDGTVKINGDVVPSASADTGNNPDLDKPIAVYNGLTESGEGDGSVYIKANDYEIDVGISDAQNPDTACLRVRVRGKPLADGVYPHGLLGQTVDLDGLPRDMVIFSESSNMERPVQDYYADNILLEGYNGLFGKSTEASAVNPYKVDGILDTGFANFNVYDDGHAGRAVPDEDLPSNVC